MYHCSELDIIIALKMNDQIKLLHFNKITNKLVQHYLINKKNLPFLKIGLSAILYLVNLHSAEPKSR